MNAESRRVKRGWMNLRVARIDEETHDTATLILVDADQGGRQFDYWAGQYLTFRFDELADKPVVRSYTMSSSPREQDFCAFTVKEVENGWISKHLVRNIRVGHILRARGPIGRFCFEPDGDLPHLVMIAAGSGVTPFVSIMREYADRLRKEDSPERMTLLVSFKSDQDLICWDTLQEVSKFPSVRVVVTLTRQDATDRGFWQGRITGQQIDDLLQGSFDGATYMTCGPTSMMNQVKEHLIGRGVKGNHIKTEAFD